MSIAVRHLGRWLVVVGAMAVAACAPARYAVKSPEPSQIRFETAAAPAAAQISVLDERRAGDVFSSGILPAGLTVGGAPLNPPQYLAEGLAAELASRGLPLASVVGDQGAPRLHLRTFRMLNHRASGFSPFVTLTFLSADVETPSGVKRLGVFVKRGKVPVWSFDEVIDPIFNDPLSLAVKELAAKVAAALYGYRSSDATVGEISARIDKRSNSTFRDVYALGFTNNPAAIPKLVALLADPDEYVRLAAISSLGTLRATGEYPRLKALYENKSGLWQDRAMAIKAIGDLDTEETHAYVAAELQRLSGEKSGRDTEWTSQLLGLYL